jgi:hypothetical protein
MPDHAFEFAELIHLVVIDLPLLLFNAVNQPPELFDLVSAGFRKNIVGHGISSL